MKLSIVLASIVVLSASLGQAEGPTSTINPTTVPFTIEQISGQRPVVSVSLGKLKYRMVVHSSAGFYLQVDHKRAIQADARILKHAGSFGLEAVGKVSALGRDEGILPLLSIGKQVWRNVPVSIFETPGNATGMLGLKWITENRVVIDYARQRLSIRPTRAATAEQALGLRQAGYTELPMSHDIGDGRYYVMAKLGDKTRRMTISTVATLTIDDAFAKAASLPTGPKSGEYGGPSGATGSTYAFGNPVQLSIGAWVSQPMTSGHIEDTYAYSGRPRPIDPNSAIGGMIGADFLIKHHAVIDFGNSKLYVR